MDNLVPKPGATKSPVWSYFGFVAGADGKPANEEKPVCRKCGRTVATKGSNTSNMLSHLRNSHPTIYSRIKGNVGGTAGTKRSLPSTSGTQQQTLAGSFAKVTPYARNSRKWEQLTGSVTFCLTKDVMPIYSVEKPGFRELLKAFDPQYELPSRKYFSNTAIPSLYTQTREKVMHEMSHAQYFAATTDLWSSTTTEPYISCTVHFVGDNWKLQSYCLQTMYCPEDHTGENLASALESTLEAWKLEPEQLSCLTTDNGSNFLKAARLLEWPHISCFGHNLHLAVTTATDDSRVSRAYGICHKIVNTFSHSWKKRRDLTQAQASLSLPKHTLCGACPTRWGSEQKMVERILEQERALRQVLGADRKSSHLIPTWQDIDVLESVNKALGPLQEFTDIMSGEKYVTVSAIKPVLKHLEEKVLVDADADTSLTCDIRRKIMVSLTARYVGTKINELLDVATFLDPRCKLDFTAEKDVASVKARVQQEAERMLNEDVECSEVQGHDVPHPSEEEPPPQRKRRLGEILQKDKSAQPTEDKTLRVSKEVERYLQAPQQDSTEDPLVWWKDNAASYPALSKLSKKYLCISATSSSSERMFSTAGNVVTKKRSLLKPEKVDMLVFLAKNL